MTPIRRLLFLCILCLSSSLSAADPSNSRIMQRGEALDVDQLMNDTLNAIRSNPADDNKTTTPADPPASSPAASPAQQQTSRHHQQAMQYQPPVPPGLNASEPRKLSDSGTLTQLHIQHDTISLHLSGEADYTLTRCYLSSSKQAILLQDQARLTISNCYLLSDSIAITLKDQAQLTINNSFVKGKNKAVQLTGQARLRGNGNQFHGTIDSPTPDQMLQADTNNFYP